MDPVQVIGALMSAGALAWLFWRWRAGREQARAAASDPAKPPARTVVNPTGGEYANPDAAWFGPGQRVTVGGFVIPDGMIYVGSRLPRVARADRADPALIDPAIPVDARRPDRTAAGLGYSPAYADLTPAQRAGYLEWLASGRASPDTPIGYVFIFYYGLERRLLVDTAAVRAAGEWHQLRAELERLRRVYGTTASFARYSAALLDVAQLLFHPGRLYELRPEVVADGSLPLTLRAAIGQLAADGRPVPADWAFEWVMQDGETTVPKPVTRCTSELRALFRQRYAAQFGAGLVLLAPAARLAVEYRTASPTFDGTLTSPTEIPDVARSATLIRPVRQLFDSCCADLDAFGRWLGRNPDGRATLASVALLPMELFGTVRIPALDELANVAARTVGAAGRGLIPGATLLQGWPASETGRLAKADAVALARILSARGFGLVPDVRFGNAALRAGSPAVLFQLPPDSPAAPTPGLSAAMLLLDMSVAVSAADRTVSRAEIRHIEEHLALSLHLAAGERARLGAHLEWLAAEPPKITGITRRAAALDPAQKQAIAQFMLGVAASDGQLEATEIATLEKIYLALGLETAAVHQEIHRMSVRSDAAPPTVAAAEPGQPGTKIPPRPPAAKPPPEGSIVLDPALIDAKLRESAAVSALLGSIFSEADDGDAPAVNPTPARPAAAAAPPGPPAATPRTIAGLDARHAALCARLVERPSWPRADVERLCKEAGLMTDGALEAINEAALERTGQTLADGDDPVTIAADIAKEM